MKQMQKKKKRVKKIQGKMVRVSVDVPERVRENFREAVERNGKTMKDVLTLYMQKYIWKQGELQRNRQKRRQDFG